MKVIGKHIFFVTRIVSFAIVLVAMIGQPVLKFAGFLDQFTIELASSDFEEDTNEQENQEEENTQEEIELQISTLAYHSFQSAETNPIYSASLKEWCFNLESHLPPPEQI